MSDTNPTRPKRKRSRSPKVTWRLNEVRKLLATTPLSDARIIEKLSLDFRCDGRTIEGYLITIRKEMAADLEAMRPTLASEILLQMKAHYGACMQAKKYEAAGRYFDRVIKMVGLEAAQKIELTGRDGAPMEIARTADLSGHSDEELEVLAKALGITERIEGKPQVH